MKLIVLTIVLFCSSLGLTQMFAQTYKIDSLENLLVANKNEDTIRVNLLNELAFKLWQIKNSRAIEYAEESKKLADKLNFKKGKATSLKLIGLNFTNKSDYTKAHECYQEALKLNNEIGNKKGISNCLNNIGMIYFYQNNYSKALDYYQKSLKIDEELTDGSGIAVSYKNIGLTYENQNDFLKATEYYQKALGIYQLLDDKQGISDAFINVGIIKNRMGDYSSALEYYNKSLKISKEIKDKNGIAKCYNNIGNTLFEQAKYDEAIEFYQKALSIDNEIGNKYGVPLHFNNIGFMYQVQGDFKTALEYFEKALIISEETNNRIDICKSCYRLGSVYLKLNNINKAIYYSTKGVETAAKNGLLNEQRENQKQLSRIYVSKKDYKKAYESYVLFKQLNDSIFNKNNIKKITSLELKYKYEKEKQAAKLVQQKKDELTAKEIEYQKKKNKVFVAGLLVALLVIFLFYRIVRIKKKANNILRAKNEKIIQQRDLISEQKSEIQAQTDELQEHKTNLEAIVEQRTAAFIKAKDQAEESDRLKMAFLNNISHEFRTPMNGIIGFSALLVQSEKSENKQKYANIVNKSCKQLLNIVNDTVEISKIHSRQSKLNKTTVNIANVIHEIINEFKESAIKKGLNISLELKIDKENLLVLLDKNKIERVFWHLIDNAIKFSFDGQIKVTANELDKGNIQFHIDDSGIGIPLELQKKIFDPFRQVETGTKRKFGGNGIGLSIAKAYIEMLGGSIWLKSQIDKGTSIFFTLPTHEKIDLESPKPINHLVEIEGKTILLAEDDETNFILIQEILSEYNINLLHVWNGREAVELIKKEKQIDIVLMDLKMPVMNGYEALKLIRKTSPNIPIFAQTAYASASDRDEIIQAGFNDIITKPIHKDKLVQMVRQRI